MSGEGPRPSGPSPRYRLRGEVGGAPRSFPLSPGLTRIGSLGGNDVVLAVRGVSRRHAVLSCDEGGVAIEDLESRNGVFVNGVRVSQARLRPGDEVRLGPALLRLEAAGRTDLPPEPAAPEEPERLRPPATHDPRAVRAAAVAAGALIAQQVAGKAVRDAFFLSNWSAASLPLVMIAASLLAIAAVFGFTRAQARHSPARLATLAIAANAVLLLAEWTLSLGLPRSAALVLYLHMGLLGATLVSGFWSLVNECFDPYTARRVVGRIGVGASLGGFLGGGLAFAIGRVVQVPFLLLLMAAINGVALVSVRRLAHGVRVPEPAAAEAPGREPRAGTLEGLRILREVPYLGSLAVIVGLGAMTETFLDFLLKAQAAADLGKGPPLVSFFALFHTGVGILGFACQGLLARRLLESVGLAGTVSILPAVAGLAAVGGLWAPFLTSAVLARGVFGALQSSLFRSGYELLFTAVPRHRRRPTKTLVDVGFDKLGTVLGGALVLLVVRFASSASARLLFALSALAALLALGLSRGLHRGYLGALAESLRSGVVRLKPADVVDATTRSGFNQTALILERETLLRQLEAVRAAAAGPEAEARVDPLLKRVRALASVDPDAVRRALRETDLDPRVAGHVVPLLARADVSRDALAALRALGPRITGLLVDRLLDPAEPTAVRARLPRALRSVRHPRAVDGLLDGLRDREFEVRFQCGLALLRLLREEAALRVREDAVFAAVEEELRSPPFEASPVTVERRLDHIFNLLSLVLDREPLRIAYRAVRSQDALRGTALEYLDNVLPETVRAVLWPLLGLAEAGPRTARPARELAEELTRSSRLERKTPDGSRR